MEDSLDREVEEVARRFVWSQVDDEYKAEILQMAAWFVGIQRDMNMEMVRLMEEVDGDSAGNDR